MRCRAKALLPCLLPAAASGARSVGAHRRDRSPQRGTLRSRNVKMCILCVSRSSAGRGLRQALTNWQGGACSLARSEARTEARTTGLRAFSSLPAEAQVRVAAARKSTLLQAQPLQPDAAAFDAGVLGNEADR